MAAREIFLSAGDESGDLHASNLMLAVRDLEPGARFSGVGLKRMIAAGMYPVEAGLAQDGAMWLHNLLRLGAFRRLLRRCREHLARQRPDLVVLVDFGGFNMFLARAASQAGIPVLYYIPPQVWAHGAYRAKKLKKWVTKLAVIYPFEQDFYRARDMEAEYVGHPLFDEIARHAPDAEVVKELRQDFGERLVGLFPGSRSQELARHLPIMTECCEEIAARLPDAAFAVACAQRLWPLARRLLNGSRVPIRMLQARPVELARAARLCITKSGTITLEIASQSCPMLIFYRASPFLYFIASGLRDSPYIGLVNLLAGRMICPERLMWRWEPSWLASRAVRLLTDETPHVACRRDIEGALADFARPGASERVARLALEMAGHASATTL